MPLTSEIKVTEDCNFPQEIQDKLTVHLKKAEVRLRELIGDAKYDELESASSGDQRDKAAQAESYLTAYYALPFLNLRVTEKGGFVMATGFEQSRNELMGKRELDGYRAGFFRQAMLLIKDFTLFENDEGDELDAGPLGMMTL
ncbi:hypothetical protein Calab_1456 [Caldithrix abyssi DSM 13497]|uniref:Uncharacterized protein n=1 Tax=Caldithrix abyssi DSM 13497 TaxID=880073 RepID=H1XPV1_CALAY|nr:hypothetical protein [Caldithrix abyssi]APF20395.1 hypothetical protein Cabys_3649 [Caldithrix abyssi DSM 13497]EHO41077.1 hypothetical protein Calab_1456 [Caldithrix abyssi DSM 13497]